MPSPPGLPEEAEAPRERDVVLVVDDEPGIRRALGRVLEAELGAEVVAVESAAEGLEVLRSRTVDLVISDYKLPGMDGLAFLSQAREAAPGLTRVLVTGYPDQEMAIQAINEARIEKFFVKPWDTEKLVATVRGALEARRAEAGRNQRWARVFSKVARLPPGSQAEADARPGGRDPRAGQGPR